jgi:hypothetical protein
LLVSCTHGKEEWRICNNSLREDLGINNGHISIASFKNSAFARLCRQQLFQNITAYLTSYSRSTAHDNFKAQL